MQFKYRYDYNPRPKIHLTITILLSILAAIIAVLLYFKAINDIEVATIYKGRVVESVANADGTYRPVIEFMAIDGKVTRFSPGFSSSIEFYPYGDEVEVFIRKQSGKPELINFLTIYGGTTFFAVFSFIAVLGSVAVYFLRIRNKF